MREETQEKEAEKMRTYQDLLKLGENEDQRKDFVFSLINEHKSSDDYKTARDACEYFKNKNVTINEYQKLLYTVTGNAIPDNYSANYKMASGHFRRFVTQEVQYLLGNGITWTDEGTADALGTLKHPFDRQLQDAAKKALWGKVAFGFFDNDHVNVFDILEFAPLYDETNGSLMAGVRFWQVAPGKPLRAVLYEIDGLTKYVWYTDQDSPLVDEPKQAYVHKILSTEADGEEIYDEENYPEFPIIPLWANSEHQSAIIGIREQIDCYDLIKSGFANTVDEASIVYWTLQNAGGMDEVDLAKFLTRMKTLHATTIDEEQSATSHTIDAPFASREALLDRLDADLYRDAMALDTRKIAGGAVTATQIRAAYEDLNAKCDDFEYQVLDFVYGIMAVAGVVDEPTFTRSMVINQSEMIGMIIESGQYLPEDYVTKKILTVLGDGDKIDDVLAEKDIEQMSRFIPPQEPTEPKEVEEEELQEEEEPIEE